MKAPQVNSWWVNKFDGKVFFEYEFDLDNKRVTELKPVSSEAAANNYLLSLNRSWLMGVFEDWLNHKRHIIDAYPNEEKKKTFGVKVIPSKSPPRPT